MNKFSKKKHFIGAHSNINRVTPSSYWKLNNGVGYTTINLVGITGTFDPNQLVKYSRFIQYSQRVPSQSNITLDSYSGDPITSTTSNGKTIIYINFTKLSESSWITMSLRFTPSSLKWRFDTSDSDLYQIGSSGRITKLAAFGTNTVNEYNKDNEAYALWFNLNRNSVDPQTGVLSNDNVSGSGDIDYLNIIKGTNYDASSISLVTSKKVATLTLTAEDYPTKVIDILLINQIQ